VLKDMHIPFIVEIRSTVVILHPFVIIFQYLPYFRTNYAQRIFGGVEKWNIVSLASWIGKSTAGIRRDAVYRCWTRTMLHQWTRINPDDSFCYRHGVNYIDSAYFYHRATVKFLWPKPARRYREKVRIATKLPCVEVHVPDDLDEYLTDR